MSGLKSRRKGLRVEYLIRDYFRNAGYRADRVPCSGASDGFKGDLKVTHDTLGTFLVEVKSRKESFKSIYDFFFRYHGERCVSFNYHNTLVALSDSFEVLTQVKYYSHWHVFENSKEGIFKRITRLRELLGEAQYLVIKGDHQPPLFLKFSNL